MPRLRRALVTGASAGIGEEFARQLAARGTDLVLVARRGDRLEELAEELRDAGREVEVLPADLATPDGRDVVAARLQRVDDVVDLLVNNAGLGAYGRFAGQDPDLLEHLVEVNVIAVQRLMHAALPGMLDRGHGAIINVASTASFQPNPYGAVYGATKTYVLNLTQAVHEEVRGRGVRLMALCPGFTTTEFQEVASVGTSLPEVAVQRADEVVSSALRALGKGQVVHVTGLANKIVALGSTATPTALTRKLSGLLHRTVAS